MTLLQNPAYQQIFQRLRDAGIPNPALEARVFLQHFPDGVPADILCRRIDDDVPLSRLVGTQEFWSLIFALSPDTLDPRQDTETLVDAALKHYGDAPPRRILDIGTGSGCILIALLHEWPVATGVGTDLSPGAVETARRNADANGVGDRARFVETSWAAGVEGPFDLIVSNPPYIRRDVIPNLDKNVRNHDPILALDGGEDGLDAYRVIITETKSLLAPGGRVFFEIGYDQPVAVQRLVENAGATPERIIPDSGGNLRVLEWRWG